MKFNYEIYVVTDSYNNKYAVVANEPADDVQISGMKNHLGERIYFESEAYHLNKWCEENGLNLNIIEMEVDV
jgi:hypothetical protein